MSLFFLRLGIPYAISAILPTTCNIPVFSLALPEPLFLPIGRSGTADAWVFRLLIQIFSVLTKQGQFVFSTSSQV